MPGANAGNLKSSKVSDELATQIVNSIKDLSLPFIARLRRRDTEGEKIVEQTIELPTDYAGYQKSAKDRIEVKVDQWIKEGKLDEGEVGKLKGIFDNRKTSFGVMDSEDFVDTVREYISFKEKRTTFYGNETPDEKEKDRRKEIAKNEKAANQAAGKLTNLLLNREELYKLKREIVVEQLKGLIEAIGKIKGIEALQWSGIQKEAEELITKVKASTAKHIEVEHALELERLMVHWPPSLESNLVQLKSRVDTKLLNSSPSLEVFDMPLDDLQLRHDCKEELEQLDKAASTAHSVPALGQTVVLKPGEINATIHKFRDLNNNLDSPQKKQAHQAYSKEVDTFVQALNSLQNAKEKGSTGKLKRQLNNTSFQQAVQALQAAVDNFEATLEEKDKSPELLSGLKQLETALKGIEGQAVQGISSSDAEKAYKALIKALLAAPATLSPNILVLGLAQEQSKHKKDSVWYRNDLFKTTKELAEGCAMIFEGLNEYHKYLNELNNFVLSMITVQEGEGDAPRQRRELIIQNLSIETITGSVKNITNWQSQDKGSAIIKKIREKIGNFSKGNVPSVLEDVIDGLAKFKKAFDPIAVCNAKKVSTSIKSGGKEHEVSTTAYSKKYNNPLNPSNEKTAKQGLVIMKGTVDTLVAVKAVVKEFTAPPSTKVLEETLVLCEKWYNAILNLKFTEDVENLSKNIDILRKYPDTSVPPPVKTNKKTTLKELVDKDGFDLSSFRNTLEQLLLEHLEECIRKESKKYKEKRPYALRFSEVKEWIKRDLKTPQTGETYEDEPISIPIIDGKNCSVTRTDINKILSPFKERYKQRIKKEIEWREEVNGKDKNIEESDGFKKSEKLTTCANVAKQNSGKIQYYLDQMKDFNDLFTETTSSMDVKVFLENVDSTKFSEIAQANEKELRDYRRSYRNTFENLLEKKGKGALPTILNSMRFTAQVSDSIDELSSQFLEIARILTSITPDNDMSENEVVETTEKVKSVVKLITTATSSVAAGVAVFVGPFAPIPLLVGGLIQGAGGVAGLIMDHIIKDAKSKQHLATLINIFEKVITTLQEVRNKVTSHRTTLQGELENVLKAIENINAHKDALEIGKSNSMQ